MPLFEYRCKGCGKKFAKLVGMTADSGEPACPHCGSKELTKLISRFQRVRSEDDKLDSFEDAALSAGTDDPKGMSRLMGEMAKEMGEDLGENADELMEEAEREIYGGEADSAE